MARVVFDPSVSSIIVDLLLEAADSRSSIVVPVVLGGEKVPTEKRCQKLFSSGIF